MRFVRVLALLVIGFSMVPMFGNSSTGFIYRGQVAVLAYHHISDTDHSNVTITPDLFRSQLIYLMNQGYRFITLEQFRQFMDGGEVPDNAVLVTFDDGYESFYLKAFPILQDLHIPAVSFVVTGDLDHPQQTNVPSMSPAEIAEISLKTSDIDFQCHSNSFHQRDAAQNVPLVTLLQTGNGTESGDQHNQRVKADTEACLSRLTAITGRTIDTYAYPFGVYDNNAVQTLQSAGIHYAFTVTNEMATSSDDPMQLPRINAGNPVITPEKLEGSIKRRILDLNKKMDYIPLRDAMTQIGATVLKDPDGITFYYRGITWKTKAYAKYITKDGVKINLDHALKYRNKKVYIHIDDLEKALGIYIDFCPYTEQFRERFTPRRFGALTPAAPVTPNPEDVPPAG